MLADPIDVEERLGRELNEVEEKQVTGYLLEASALVESHTGRTFDEPVPVEVRLVTSRMVARVLEAPKELQTQEGVTYSAGPFSMSPRFSPGASGGSPWLTAVDKKILSRFRKRRGGIYSLRIG